jgi:hypothetical protein
MKIIYCENNQMTPKSQEKLSKHAVMTPVGFSASLMLLIIGWILMMMNSKKNSSKKSYLQYLTLSMQTMEFEWSVVQNNTSAPKEDSPIWTNMYIKSGFANAEKRLFGTNNYKFYIGTIQCILGNHQIWCTDTKGPKGFLLNK